MTAPNRHARRTQQQMRRKLKVGDNGPMYETPMERWPTEATPPNGMFRLLKNDRFIVFVCARPKTPGILLLMVQRVDGRPGITWDELYQVKELCGFAECEAVEIYPERGRLVNYASMRHLWVFPPGVRCEFGLDPERA